MISDKMEIGNSLLEQLDRQTGFDGDIEDICIMIYTENDYIPYCFIADENHQFLTVLRTMETGSEKLTLIAKHTIERIDIAYADDMAWLTAPAEPEIDKMVN